MRWPAVSHASGLVTPLSLIFINRAGASLDTYDTIWSPRSTIAGSVCSTGCLLLHLSLLISICLVQPSTMNRSSVALVNLRAVVILIVLAFHSLLPYLASLPAAAYPFDSAPYLWLAFPIVDSQRWFGFDLFCAWQDVVSAIFRARCRPRFDGWPSCRGDTEPFRQWRFCVS